MVHAMRASLGQILLFMVICNGNRNNRGMLFPMAQNYKNHRAHEYAKLQIDK